MSSKPIVPRNGKAMTNWVNQDGSPLGDNWHLHGLDGVGDLFLTPQAMHESANIVTPGPVFSASPPFSLASGTFSQNWSGTSALLTADSWAALPYIVGYRGDGLTNDTSTDPQTVLADGSGTPISLINASNSASTAGGVHEINDTVVALQGSGTADAPHLVIYLNSTGVQNVRFQCNLVELDSTTIDQKFAIQYRVGGTGNYVNLPGAAVSGFFNAAGNQTKAIDIILPAACDNQGQLEIRIITNDAVGSDAMVGIDDIVISSTPLSGPPSLSINDVSHVENDSGTVTYTFTVSLTGPAPAGGVTFDIATANNTATTADNDYVAKSLTSQTIPEGASTYTFDVTVNGDDVPEGNETFFVNVTNIVGATAGDTQGLGTITNDDAYGVLAINDVILAEGNSGTTNFIFTVTRSGGDDGTVSADYTVNLPGGAGGADSADVSGTLNGTVTFLDGETSKTITVTVNGDLVEEPTETFTVTLSNQQGGVTISDGSGLGTITNDDSPPVGSINDVSIAEGADGVSYMTFTVSLDHGSTSTVTFNYATANGTATAGSDYVARSGQISFAPGETSHTISIPIIGDTASEANETLTVTLSNPVNASVGDGSGTGTITNDDGSAYYSLAGGSFSQNWSNTGLITTSDNWSGVPYIIGFRGDDLTTSVGADARTILTTSNVIDVNANQTNPNTNTGGGVTEFDSISNPVVALQGSGTADAPYLALYMDASGRSSIRVQANLRDIDGSSDDAAQQIAVQYRTSPNGPWLNAPGGYFADVTVQDTTQPSGFTPLVTAVDITLPADANGAATLEIRFLTTNATGNDEWVGIDDIVVSSQQSGPTLSIGNTAVFEGDAGNTPITFTVTRAGSSSGAVTADWTVNFPGGANGAVSSDFAVGQAFTGQVHFADGQTSATITLNVAGDTGPELDDNFTVTLSNIAGGTIADGVGTGTIVNDDGQPPLVTVNDVTVTEGDSGTSLMTFTVTRTGGTGAFDVNYETQDGTASAGSDYDATSGTLHFNAGQMSQQVTVTIHGDTASELSETLNFVLSNPTNFALLTDPTGVGTIAGDDPIYIHDIQGTSYFSPLLAAEGIHGFNIASAGLVTVRAIVTAVDNVGSRQGYYLSEEITDWDGNSYTSEGIFVMTRNDAGLGNVVSGVTVGDLVQISAHVMEYRDPDPNHGDNMPSTILVDPTGLSVISQGNPLPTMTLTHMPNEVLTGATPDYFDSHDDPNDSFDASTYALSYFETVEGMLVTIPNMVVADGFTQTAGGALFFQAYSLDSANPDQINSRGGYTVSGDPPVGPPDTPEPGDDTHNGGHVVHDGDINPDIIQVEYGGFGQAIPAGLGTAASMGDRLGDLTGIIDFDFTDRVLYVTDSNPASFVDNHTTQETTLFGNDSRSLTFGAFNVNNLSALDTGRFGAIADAIAHNLNAPDIISIEEIQDNNGTGSGTTDASATWQALVNALNAAVPGAHYQWVDQEPNGSEGGAPGGNIRVGFLYNTDRVQLGDLAANATLDERRQFTDRIGDGVRDANDRIAYDDSMIAGEIATSDWSSTRRSLLGEFTFHGNTVYVTANHFTSKLGSGEFWQFDQDLAAGDPVNEGLDKRAAQAQDVYTMLNLIQQSNPNVGIISGGDYNDFYFSEALTTLTGYTTADGVARVGGTRFDNLTLTLSEAERYTYAFDGRSQAIDHIVVNDLLAGIATYDVVHLNTGFNPNDSQAISDHDPGVSTYDFREFAEVLAGTGSDDLINGFGGNDTIFGNGGNDALIGGGGADMLYGMTGDDSYLVDSADVVIEAAGQGNDSVYTSASYALAAGASVEVLQAYDRTTTGMLILTGNELGQTIYGNDGVNALIGGGGADILYGLGGGDAYLVDSADDVVTEFAGQGNDSVYTTVGYALAAGASVEVLTVYDRTTTNALNLTGNEFSQTIYGNAAANSLIGGGGADTFYGMAGDDAFLVDSSDDVVNEFGGQGSDSLYTTVGYTLAAGASVEVLQVYDRTTTAALNLTGNELNQTIYGNNGANIVNGGAGNDTLYGMGGADTFAFTTALGAGNVDNIADFLGGTDKIGLSAAVFSGVGSAGNPLNGNAFFAGTAAHDANDRIIYDAATGNLYYDADGTGASAQVLFANLQGHPTLTATDFQVI